MTLGVSMQHKGLGPNKVCSNDDLELTLSIKNIVPKGCFLLRWGYTCMKQNKI